jgi:hypothetical protein
MYFDIFFVQGFYDADSRSFCIFLKVSLEIVLYTLVLGHTNQPNPTTPLWIIFGAFSVYLLFEISFCCSMLVV